MNVLITTSSFDKAGVGLAHRLENIGLKPILNPFRRRLTEDEAFELVSTYRPVGMIAGVEPLTKSVLSLGANHGLQVVSRCGIGMDSVDLDAAQACGIQVFNTPDGPTRAVAELVLGQILGLCRQLHLSDRSIRKGEWRRPMGSLLFGKTVGVIGCGRIGNLVSSLLQAFGCTVVGFDPFGSLPAPARMVSFETLLKTSDIVTLHIPYTPENRGLMGATEFAMMKPNSVLINSARGGIVEEDALFEALKNGNIAAAAVDTFESEPYVGRLTELENVLLTAHVGSYARESRVMMERDATSNLIEGLDTTPIQQVRLK